MPEFKIGDLNKSAKAFKDIVWPKISNWFGDGELIPVESVTDSKMTELLDRYSSIDAWYIETKNGIRGLSSRVQWGNTNWKSFTIRKERFSGARTEFEKLCNAINNDWLYPYWFCQSYLNNDEILGSASCKIIDLVNYLKNNPKNIRFTDNASFYYAYWDDFKKHYQINELGEHLE